MDHVADSFNKLLYTIQEHYVLTNPEIQGKKRGRSKTTLNVSSFNILGFKDLCVFIFVLKS